MARRSVPPLLAFLLLAAPAPALADRCVAVFFRGFNAPVGTSGMDNLAAHLSAAFGGDPARPFSIAVFNWFQQQAAFDFSTASPTSGASCWPDTASARTRRSS